MKNDQTTQNCVQMHREARGMTQQELADAIGVSRQTISSLEKGDYTPSVLLAIKIATVFNSSVERIFEVCVREDLE